MAAAIFAAFFLSLLSFTGFHPETGFSQNEHAAYMPAFITFGACALLLPGKWLRLAGIVFCAIDYVLICMAFGYPTPGASAAFGIFLAGWLLKRSDAR